MHDTPPAINKEDSNYHSKLFDPAKMRKDIKPLNVVQPEGPSFRCIFGKPGRACIAPGNSYGLAPSAWWST